VKPPMWLPALNLATLGQTSWWIWARARVLASQCPMFQSLESRAWKVNVLQSLDPKMDFVSFQLVPLGLFSFNFATLAS